MEVEGKRLQRTCVRWEGTSVRGKPPPLGLVGRVTKVVSKGTVSGENKALGECYEPNCTESNPLEHKHSPRSRLRSCQEIEFHLVRI